MLSIYLLGMIIIHEPGSLVNQARFLGDLNGANKEMLVIGEHQLQKALVWSLRPMSNLDDIAMIKYCLATKTRRSSATTR